MDQLIDLLRVLQLADPLALPRLSWAFLVVGLRTSEGFVFLRLFPESMKVKYVYAEFQRWKERSKAHDKA